MIDQIKNLRLKIDGLAQLTKKLKPIQKGRKYQRVTLPVNIRYINSKEIEKAVDSLYLAKAWLGKVLGELGNENPYGSGYKTVEDIIPTQDVNQDMHEYNLDVVHFEDKNNIEKVDWLRQEIEKVVEELVILQISNNAFHNTIYQHLSEAKFWLGFELQRIKGDRN